MENEYHSLFAYRPDRRAAVSRMVEEAKKLYEMGLEKERHQPVAEDYEGKLEKFYLYPTFNCPLRCPYCYAEGGERKGKELSATEYLRITGEAIAAGYKAVVLVGGEPLVYAGFKEYLEGLEKLEKKGVRFVLRTSFAFPISHEMMEKMCRCFDEITVSIDGDEETNDDIRGKGTWQYATTNTRRAVSMGGNVSISAVLYERNEKAEGFLKDFCKELGIKKLVLNSPVPMGRAKETQIPYFEWRSDRKQATSIKMRYSCGLGHSLYMQPDGSVYPCYAWCEKEHKLGDLSRESLKEILDRKEILSIINCGVDTNEKCKECEVRYLCGGMCKIWVNNKRDINSGDFDCEEKKQEILAELRRYRI